MTEFSKDSVEAKIRKIADDFGGVELFSEENANRLRKAFDYTSVDSINVFRERVLLLGARKKIPYLYSQIGNPVREQQVAVDSVFNYMMSVGFSEDVSYETVTWFSNILNLPEPTPKHVKVDAVLDSISFEQCYQGYSTSMVSHKTCKIGKQLWLAENLKLEYDRRRGYYSHFSCGKECPNSSYGRLYTWNEAVNPELVPPGWRLPRIEDWRDLHAYIKSLGYDSGTALKSTNQWHGKADDGLDLFGFCAYPTVLEEGVSQCWFWTNSDTGNEKYPKYCVSLDANENDLGLRSRAGTGYCASVRYVKDV